jgi:hypothetical protein
VISLPFSSGFIRTSARSISSSTSWSGAAWWHGAISAWDRAFAASFVSRRRGERSLRTWLMRRPAWPPPLRDEIFIRLLAVERDGPKALLDQLARQESEYRRYVDLVQTEVVRPEASLTRRLAHEAALRQVEAHLREPRASPCPENDPHGRPRATAAPIPDDAPVTTPTRWGPENVVRTWSVPVRTRGARRYSTVCAVGDFSADRERVTGVEPATLCLASASDPGRTHP